MFALETTIAVSTVIAATTLIINHVAAVTSVESTITITITVVIRTEIRVSFAEEHRTIGIIEAVETPDLEPSRDHHKMVMGDLFRINSSSNSQNQTTEMIRRSIHAGKSLHRRSKISSSNNSSLRKATSALAENGISHVAAMLITQFRYHVMNVLNRSYLEPLIRASISTNTKTFPWKRRVNKFLIIFHPSMISS